MVKLTPHRDAPPHVRDDVRRYEIGAVWRVPRSYTEWQDRLARIELRALVEKFDLLVEKVERIPAPTEDGVEIVEAIVRTQRQALLKLLWNDEEQRFMRVFSEKLQELVEQDLS